MATNHISCIPDNEQIVAMTKAGYKFKLQGKFATKKKIEEFIKNSEAKRT